MKLTDIKSIILLSAIVLLNACQSDSTTTISSDASFSSLTFKKNDSIPKLSTAVFTLEKDPDVGDMLIVNLDSLPYKTRINKVSPIFTFKSTSAQYLISDSKTITLTGKDTIDFTQSWMVKNVPSDKNDAHSKEYRIRVNVHQVEPELYTWKKISSNLEAFAATSEKAIADGDTMFYFMNNGTEAKAYKSTDGQSWTPLTLSGFPVNSSLTNMQLFKGKVFVAGDGNNIYSSSNKRTWVSKTIAGYKCSSLMYVFLDKLWAIVSDNNSKYHFATSQDGDNWVIQQGEITAGFPVRDFTAISFTNRLGLPKVLIVGGKDAGNNTLTKRWSTEDGALWVEFSKENRTLDTLDIGSSIISYDKKLFVFGKRSDKDTVVFKQSLDEGLSWQVTDTLNRLRQPHIIVGGSNDGKKDTIIYTPFNPRKNVSAIVLRPKNFSSTNDAAMKNEIIRSNRIFLIGGMTNSTPLTDLWTSKLNRKNFLRQ